MTVFSQHQPAQKTKVLAKPGNMFVFLVEQTKKVRDATARKRTFFRIVEEGHLDPT